MGAQTEVTAITGVDEGARSTQSRGGALVAGPTMGWELLSGRGERTFVEPTRVRRYRAQVAVEHSRGL